MGFSYDANGRMVKATQSSVPDALTVYDALGNRVAAKVNDVWTFMIYDAFGKLVAEYGGVSSSSVSAGPNISYIQQDWQGSVRAVTNANGFVVSRTDYSAFGETVGNGIGLRSTAQGYWGTTATRQGYGLTEQDEATGLDHTWFRKNEGSAGRWTSPDPFKGSMSLGNPQSFNRYSYVVNQPTNFVDPSGLDDDDIPEEPGIIRIDTWEWPWFTNFIDSRFWWYPPNPPNPPPVTGGDPGGGVESSPQPKEDCNELAKQIKAFLDSLQRRARQMMQNLGGYKGPQLDIYVKRFKEEQQGLRNRLDDWNTQGCGGPGPTVKIPENAWKWATDPPPPPGITPATDLNQMVQVAAGVIVTVGVAYVLYRIVRLLPSMAPPLWWSIPANVAIP